jgi:O-antigen ligase
MKYLLYLGLCPLLFFPVWAAAGTFRAWQEPFPWLALWAWICFLACSPSATGHSSRKARLLTLLKDPWIYPSLLFILLIWVQFRNSGRILLFDFDTHEWVYGPPPNPRLPGAFTEIESREMLMWFIPVLSAFHILRLSWNGLNPRRLVHLVLANGFLNAGLGFLQLAMGWQKMYNRQQFGHDLYGSFGYPNHAATYFILMTALALGIFLAECIKDRSERSGIRLSAYAVLYGLFVLSAHLTASRAGMLGTWVVSGLTLTAFAVPAWPRLHPVQRLYAGFSLGAGLFSLIGLFRLFATPRALMKLGRLTHSLDVSREFYARFFQIETAIAIWKEAPWFGVGGWGYRYLVSFHLEPEYWNLLNRGKANVHNDFFQFLAEFGLVGLLLLILPCLPILWRIRKTFRTDPVQPESFWADPVRFAAGFGLLAALGHSMIDLPFRSPAVYLHMCVVFVLLLPHPGIPSFWHPVVQDENLFVKQSLKKGNTRRQKKDRRQKKSEKD